MLASGPKSLAAGHIANFQTGPKIICRIRRIVIGWNRAGDRVIFWANLYCGKCDMCQAGQEQLCREVNGTNYIGFVCSGAYAEYYVGKASNAYLLPDAVSDAVSTR